MTSPHSVIRPWSVPELQDIEAAARKSIRHASNEIVRLEFEIEKQMLEQERAYRTLAVVLMRLETIAEHPALASQPVTVLAPSRTAPLAAKLTAILSGTLALVLAADCPVTSKMVAEAAGITPANARSRLERLKALGMLSSPTPATFALIDEPQLEAAG